MKRLLTLDGGGIRGVFSLEVLARIEQLLREKTGNANLVLADHFHYLGGTSTGAIIATCLSWGMSVAEVHELYTNRAIEMFRLAPFISGSGVSSRRMRLHACSRRSSPKMRKEKSRRS